AKFAIQINGAGTTAGIDYDQVNVTTGNVTIDSTTTIDTTGSTFNGASSGAITLINNAGTTPAISGTFSNLPTEGSTLTVNGTGLPGFYTFNTPGGKNTSNDLAVGSPVSVSTTNRPDNIQG